MLKPTYNPGSPYRRPGTLAIAIYSVSVLIACLVAETRSKHPGWWVLGLTASIPIFAAGLRPFLSRSLAGRR